MPDIQILSPHLADLIAAGEVVERPASVVKELVENAFDAGARTVTVELRGGGATYLRVTDDGCGMAPEDAGIAFLRHATSKLHDEQGLEAIGTMGFRGEALAAISAVSHITLTTRQRGAASGTHMTLDAGDIQDMYETGCPEGTTMIVRDLFFNTPARRKFLKSDRAEGAACAAAAMPAPPAPTTTTSASIWTSSSPEAATAAVILSISAPACVSASVIAALNASDVTVAPATESTPIV